MSTRTESTDTAPATCSFKSRTNKTVETRRYDGNPWVVGIEGWDREMTAVQARRLADELNDAADGVVAMNKQAASPVSIEGRELLVLQPSSMFQEDLRIFADGKPKRIVRHTSTDDPTVRMHPVSDSHTIDEPVWSKTDGRGKNKYTVHYELLGWYELLIAGNADAGTMLLARVTEPNEVTR